MRKTKLKNLKLQSYHTRNASYEIKILSEKPFLSNFIKIQSDNLPFRRGTLHATLNLQILLIWSYIKISTKKKTHSAALNVPLNTWLLLIWKYMKIRTRVKYHSAALNVPLNWWILLIWRYMKIRTKMKNHSAALNATLNPRIWLSEGTWNQDQNEKPFKCC